MHSDSRTAKPFAPAPRKLLRALVHVAVWSAAMLVNDGLAQQTFTADLSLEVEPRVKISGLDNMILEPYTVTTNVPAIWYNWEPFCIYSNSSSQFELTTTGSGPGGAYEITNGANSLSYRAFFYTPTEGVTRMFSGVTQTVSDAHRTSADCAGTNTTWFAPSFNKTEVDAADAGTVYTGTISFTVAPI